MASLAPVPGSAANVRVFAQPRTGRAKLRVGVFADRARQPRWLVEALAKVAASDFAELAFVAIEARHGPPAIAEPLAWRTYRSLDRWLFASRDAWAEGDVALLVAPERRLGYAPGAPREALHAEHRARHGGIDVAFVMGDIDEAALDGIARFGTWRYCFGESHATREALAAVQEVIDAAAVTASGIRIRRPGEADRIASPSWSRTIAFSLARTREGLLAKSAEFLARTLRDLHAFGAPWLDQATFPAQPLAPQSYPRGTALAGSLARLAARVARRTAEHQLSVGQWQLAWRFADVEPWSGSLAGFHRLVPPRDRFWADPFPIEANGRHYIFFEELPFAAGKAHISAVEVDRAGNVSRPVRVLERDYHLSYPFLIEEGGALYMIPESAQQRTVEVYRCVEFPHRWKLERTLLRDVWAADATFHRTGDRWWMFLAMGADGGEVNDELHLFHAERLLGDWKPHRRNPVKSDVRGARPAGRLFVSGGALHRPAQVCTPIYGAAIALNRVTRLDEGDYAEEEVRRIAPAPGEGVLGMHTINRAGALGVTDLFVRRPRFAP
ncbi:MAG TPA: hypothetical protein VFJ86_13155 [Usitatibacter sp.]|nr:hypothetical protein [Usitatibacter sp.]